jgi:Arc/MetJ-type ribon-helix-helix transcriptional regulator
MSESDRDPFVGFRIEERVLDRVDELVEQGEFCSRSELLREGARRVVQSAAAEERLHDSDGLSDAEIRELISDARTEAFEEDRDR